MAFERSCDISSAATRAMRRCADCGMLRIRLSSGMGAKEMCVGSWDSTRVIELDRRAVARPLVVVWRVSFVSDFFVEVSIDSRWWGRVYIRR